MLDRARRASYEVIVTATDRYGLSDSIALTIVVTTDTGGTDSGGTGTGGTDSGGTGTGGTGTGGTGTGGTGTGGGTGGGGAGGGGGGSTNRPPVVEKQIAAQVLDVGDSVRLDVTEHFRDPERRTMTFEAESGDATVASVALGGGMVTVTGVAHGVTSVMVTALDHRGLRATQEFAVSVGRQVSFADAAVSVAEGDSARLPVAINRARDTATTLAYVFGVLAEGAPADAHDHDGMDGTVTIAAAATEAVIEVAVYDDSDIEPPREAFTVTLQASEAQLQEFGLGTATVQVTIDEGVCDRTRQVRNVLRGSLPCASVTATDLAFRNELDLSNTALDALRGGDLSGLTGLRRLDLSDNRLPSLPAGLFEGLAALEQVHLEDNPGAPFTLLLELARTDGELWSPGPATLVARVREGAPFALRAELSIVNGTLTPQTALVPVGSTVSVPLRVLWETAGATRVAAAAPSVPDTRCGAAAEPCYGGITTVAGAPLVLFKAPPAVTDPAMPREVATDGDEARLDLSALFAASDGGALTFIATSSDPTLVTVIVQGGVLRVRSNDDGAEGTATIAVTATDADGLSTTQTFELTVAGMRRSLLRGWRRVLLEQAAQRARTGA